MAPETSDVSVTLAVRNGAEYLREAIDSVLAQTVPPRELIVVDDGSTDDTPSVMARYGDAIRGLRQANGGQAAAISAGIGMSKGDFLAFQDADDLWAPRKIELQLAALADDPSIDAVFGWSEQFVSPEIGGPDRLRLEPPHKMLRGEISTCMMIRRSSFDRVGPFDPTLSMSFFVDWLAHAKRLDLRMIMLDDIVHRRRLHMTNNGRVNTDARDQQMLSTLRRHIVRNRNN